MKNTGKIIKSKLRCRHGESMSETLVALLVMSMAITVISGSMVTAARINRKAADMETSTMLKAGAERSSSNPEAKLPTIKSNKTVTFSKSGEISGTKSLNVNYYTDPAGGADFKFYELPDGD